MKAQQFFNNSKPSGSGADKTQRQVGSATAGPGSNRGQADHKAYRPKTSGATSRPNLPGKVDNRRVGPQAGY